MAPVQTEEPAQLLRVDGRACKKFRSTEQYAALEALDGFIAWNGRNDNMIDRFDGRALLDFYRKPDESVRKRPKTEAQLELEEVSRHCHVCCKPLVCVAGSSWLFRGRATEQSHTTG